MDLANNTAYFNTATITAVKGFIVQAPGANYATDIFKDLDRILHP
jgi:hypothetical protein